MKRIVLDENGNVIAVVPVEFQTQEATAEIRAKPVAAVHATGFGNALASGVIRYDSANNRLSVSAGMFVYREALKNGSIVEEIIAYIPPAYQVNLFH